jgi:hypothetical protein
LIGINAPVQPLLSNSQNKNWEVAMFKTNVGPADRVVRVFAGLALLTFTVLSDGAVRWFGLIGLVPLLTGLFATCPAYSLFGVNTCGAAKPG